MMTMTATTTLARDACTRVVAPAMWGLTGKTVLATTATANTNAQMGVANLHATVGATRNAPNVATSTAKGVQKKNPVKFNRQNACFYLFAGHLYL